MTIIIILSVKMTKAPLSLKVVKYIIQKIPKMSVCYNRIKQMMQNRPNNFSNIHCIKMRQSTKIDCNKIVLFSKSHYSFKRNL